MKTIYAILFVLCCAVPAAAAGSDAVQGIGTATCAEFKASPQNEESLFNWTQGFMSGLNFFRAMEDIKIVKLTSMPLPAQKKYVRDFCDKHPAGKYLEAVTSLYGGALQGKPSN